MNTAAGGQDNFTSSIVYCTKPIMFSCYMYCNHNHFQIICIVSDPCECFDGSGGSGGSASGSMLRETFPPCPPHTQCKDCKCELARCDDECGCVFCPAVTPECKSLALEKVCNTNPCLVLGITFAKQG